MTLMTHQQQSTLPKTAGPLILFYFYYYYYFLIFWSHHAACGILVPRTGIKLAPPAVEMQSLNHWTAREVPGPLILTFT